MLRCDALAVKRCSGLMHAGDLWTPAGRRGIRKIWRRAVLEKLRGKPGRAGWWAAVAAVAGLLMATCGATSCASEDTAPPDEIVLPNLVGLYWKDASKQLLDVGWTGAIEKMPDAAVEPKDRERIVVQRPGGGEHVPRDVVITLQFGAP
ncbi:hypothetical protein BA059_04955 [Mycolicibacterium sp. (ex Dasyatis americana)]|nr:hypothetical protein BA059_04955 [Mycolicibacterium sp. (ex Dasyatis americana)]